MEISQIIGVTIALLASAIFWVFKRQERMTQLEYLHRTQLLIDKISVEKKQISIRQRALNVYDFLIYNISEALRIQPIINLDS